MTRITTFNLRTFFFFFYSSTYTWCETLASRCCAIFSYSHKKKKNKLNAKNQNQKFTNNKPTQVACKRHSLMCRSHFSSKPAIKKKSPIKNLFFSPRVFFSLIFFRSLTKNKNQNNNSNEIY